MLLYVIGTLVSQTILLWMAYRKRERTVRARHSIVGVTIRDGVVAFVLSLVSDIQFTSRAYLRDVLSRKSHTVFFLLLFVCVLYDSPMTALTI